MEESHSASELLQRGIVAAKAGQKEVARELFMQAIELDKHNEQAWLWLSGVATTPDHMRSCLKHVLAINANNQQARKGLAWLDENPGSLRAERVHPAPEAPRERYTLPAAPGSHAASDDRFQPETSLSNHDHFQSAIAEDEFKRDTQSSWLEPQQVVFTDVAPQAPAQSPHRSDQRPAYTSKTMGIPPTTVSDVSDTGSGEPDLPCPYCGAPTALSQRYCLKCKRALSLRLHAESKRSLALTMLGSVTALEGILLILVSIAGFAAAISLYQLGQNPQDLQGLQLPGLLTVILWAIIALLAGIVTINIARSLFQQIQWAFYGIIGLTILLPIAIISLPAMMTTLANLVQVLPFSSRAQAEALKQSITGLNLCSIALVMLHVGLIAGSYRDFFGSLQRFIPSFPIAEHSIHYNNGVAYKNRGMWYMAMREWEGAILKAPNNVTYLHALGLAYAQLQRFERARNILDRAISLDPNQAQLRESRALVEKMASR